MLQRKQDGFSVALVAIMLTGLCGMAALAVDVGVLYTTKNSEQNASDAAALAGAFTYETPQASASAAVAAAPNAAIGMAAANTVFGTPVAITAADVTVNPPDNSPGIHDVTVTVPRTGANAIPAYFAQVLGFHSFNLTATATAEYTGVGGGSINLRPIFVPNTILSSEPTAQACSDGQVILDGSGNLTAWAQSQIGAMENVRPTSPGGALEPSQFFSLDFGGGANVYRCSLGSPSLLACGVNPAVIACGSTYLTEPGNMVGPTEQGVANLLGSNPDTWIGPGAYQHGNGTVTDTSPQLMTVPVWDSCGPLPGHGKASITMIGFSSWFLDGYNSSASAVQANFVNAAGCPGNGGICPTGGPTSPNAGFGIAVRLVHN
ncbi:MAG: pilus assembly protein TadG-related protein [Terriglobales bacterium]